MKYDSSMTQFHEDIVSAIKSMIYGDIDKVAELAAEGSPVPLRDYLRERHGRSFHGGNKFDCMSSAFLVKFDRILNNLGDTKLQLSWSQTAGFIRKYPSEIFSDEESTDDILPDKNSLELLCNTFDESKIECPFWHTGQTMRYVNIGGVDFKCDYCECSFCEFDKLTEFLASHCHDYEECLYYRKHKDDKSDFPCDDCGYDVNNCCSYPDTPDDYCVCGDKKTPAPALNDTAATFDYSDLDSETAAKLENVTAEIFNVRKEYIFTMAKKVAYAHDLLANHYGGKFGTWCESIGITRQTANNLIQVVKLFDNSTIEEQENLNKLADGNVKLLYEAARPSAPPELVEQVKSGDITTHKEYIKLKKELEAAEEHNAVLTAEKEQFHNASKANLEKLNEERERNAELEKQLSEVKESLNISEDDVRKAEERAEYAENKVTEISVKNRELERRLKEIESRPVDVAVDVDELNRRVSEAANKMNSEMEHTLAAERRDFADTLNAKDDRIWELEDEVKKLKSSSASAPAAKILAFQMSMEQYKKLLEIVSGSHNSELYKVIQGVKIFS